LKKEKDWTKSSHEKNIIGTKAGLLQGCIAEKKDTRMGGIILFSGERAETEEKEEKIPRGTKGKKRAFSGRNLGNPSKTSKRKSGVGGIWGGKMGKFKPIPHKKV